MWDWLFVGISVWWILVAYAFGSAVGIVGGLAIIERRYRCRARGVDRRTRSR